MAKPYFENTIFDVAKVIVLNVTALGISLSTVKEIIQIISLTLAAIYTGYKFIKEIKKND
jgi:hypothetical protein